MYLCKASARLLQVIYKNSFEILLGSCKLRYSIVSVTVKKGIMAKSAQSIAADLNEIMRKNGNECVTLKWDQFYEICERDRLADVVMENISKHVKKFDLHVIYGNNVIVVRDFCWRPVTL